MGGDGDDVRAIAVEITRGWEHSENFELYDDALPALGALRDNGLRIGLVSNTGRDLDAFVRHFGLDVDAWISSGVHGKVKPSPTIFRAVLEMLEVEPEDAAMVGDSPADDVEGARQLGRAPSCSTARAVTRIASTRCPTLLDLPAALGLEHRWR